MKHMTGQLSLCQLIRVFLCCISCMCACMYIHESGKVINSGHPPLLGGWEVVGETRSV